LVRAPHLNSLSPQSSASQKSECELIQISINLQRGRNL
jgi:hypothetical protein